MGTAKSNGWNIKDRLYRESDLSYVKLAPKVGYGGPGKVIYTEPSGDDSY